MDVSREMTASNFNGAVDLILAHEGGYSNDSRDPGGETNFGISKKAFPQVDIKKLTRKQAVDLYREHYWQPMKCDQLPSGTDLMAFDAAVQHGAQTAAKLLQKAAGVVADGNIGPITLAAVIKQGTCRELAARRMEFYATLPHFKTYGLGWSRRLMAVFERSTALRSQL